MVCYATDDIQIPLGETSEIPISHSVPLEFSSQMFFYSGDNADKKLLNEGRVFDGLLGGQTKGVLMMAGDRKMSVKKGQIVGTLSIVLEQGVYRLKKP